MLKFGAILCIATASVVHSKIFERCELAQVLINANVTLDDIPRWICIANNAGLDTSLLDITDGIGTYGVFQISERYFCSTTTKGKICGIQCSQLIDGNLDDDIACALTIYNRHQKLQGDGWLAWSSIEGCGYEKWDSDKCNLGVQNDLHSFNDSQSETNAIEQSQKYSSITNDLPKVDLSERIGLQSFNDTQSETNVTEKSRKFSYTSSTSAGMLLIPRSQTAQQIQVVFDIGENGIIHVSGRDKRTGKDRKIIIHSSGSLSEDKHVVNNVETDKAQEEGIHAESKIFDDATESEHQRHLPHDKCSKLHQNIASIIELLTNIDVIDPLEMRKLTDTLRQSTLKSFQMYHRMMVDEREGSENNQPIWH